jgi:hypothetical protein
MPVLNGALQHVAVPDQTPAAIIHRQMSVGCERFGHLRFDGLGKL